MSSLDVARRAASQMRRKILMNPRCFEAVSKNMEVEGEEEEEEAEWGACVQLHGKQGEKGLWDGRGGRGKGRW